MDTLFIYIIQILIHIRTKKSILHDILYKTNRFKNIYIIDKNILKYINNKKDIKIYK